MESAADAGDGAVGTAVVAALCDLEICKVFGGGDNTVACGLHLCNVLKGGILTLALNGFNGIDDFVKRADTDQRIDLRQLLKDLLTVTLCQTAGHNDAL